MKHIHFFYEDISFVLKDAPRVSTWIANAIQNEKHTLGELNFIFCSDQHLLEVNKQYLDHDYFTDIITFDNSEKEKLIEGDIFISVDRVKENAIDQSVSFNMELNRVMIHGVLHLIGYNDKSDDEKHIMREKENAYLSLPEIQCST